MAANVSKAVLITGCSTGIGRATAGRLARSGWTVYATARRPESIADLAQAGCKTLALDVTDEDSMRAAVQTEHPEHLRGHGIERLVRQREHRADLHRPIGGDQHVEPVALVRQLFDQFADAAVGTGVESLGDDPQRQRQVRAHPHQPRHGCRVGAERFGADDLSEQCGGIGVGQGRDIHAGGSLRHVQAR